MPRSADSVSSRENIISSRESELALIRFNEDRITQIDEEIIRLTKKIDELDNPKQKDSFLVSSLKRRISTIQSRIAELNGQKSDLQAENKTLSQKLAPPLERPSLVITSKIDTSRLATRDNDEREFDLKRRESILKEIETLQRELASPRDLSKNPDIRDTQLRTINLKKDRLAKLKEELGSLSASRVERDDQKLLTSLLSQGFQEDGSQKPPELTETAEDELLKRLLSEEVPLSPAVVSGDLVAKRMQESQVYIENKAVSLRQEFAELITKIEYLTKEVDRLSTEHSELRQTLTNRQSKLSKRDRSELQSRMGRKYNELISAEEHLRDYSLRLEDVKRELEDIDSGKEINQISQEPVVVEISTSREEERLAELKAEQSRIISEATNYFQRIWESGIIKDFAALDEFLKSSEFIQARDEYLERISTNLRDMLPLNEFSEKGLTRETLVRFIESYSAGILTGIVFASVKNTYPNVYQVMAVFSKNRLSKCVSALNHFGILPTSGKDSGEIQLPSNTATENRSRDKIIEDARIFSSLLRSSGPHSSAFNAYLQFLDIEGLDASPSTDVNKIDDSEVISWMDRFIVNLVRNFPKINDNITSERQLSLFTSYIRSQISGKNLEYSRDRESVEDAIRLVVQNISAQEVLSIVGKPTIREKVSNFSNWLKKQTVRVATAATLAASTLALAGLGGSNAEDSEIKPAPEELVEGTVPYNAGIEEALRQAGDSLAVTPSESRARYSLIREQLTKPENNEVTEFLGLPISSTELDSDLELPENIRYIKVDGHVSEEDFDSGSILINGQEFKVLNKDQLSHGSFKPEVILEISKNIFSKGTGLILQDDLRTFFIEIKPLSSSYNFGDIEFTSKQEYPEDPISDSDENLPSSLPEGYDSKYKPVVLDLGVPKDQEIRETVLRTIGSERFSVVWQSKQAVCEISAVTSAYNSLMGSSYDTYDMASALFSSYSRVPLLEPFNTRTIDDQLSRFGYTKDFLESQEMQRSILDQAKYIQSNFNQDSEPGRVSSFAALGVEIDEVNLKGIVSEENTPEENAQKFLEFLASNVSKDRRFLLSVSLGGEQFLGKHVLNIVGVNLEEGYIILADTNAYKEANFYGSAVEGGFFPTVTPVESIDSEEPQDDLYGYWKLSLKGQSPDKISTTLENINYLRMMTKFNSSN